MKLPFRLISAKQQQANRQNAQHSTGPTSEAGKAAVSCNALKYGLRTRRTILPGENEQVYYKLWDKFEAEWQPQTITERAYVETMVTSQWLLRRMAEAEQDIYSDITDEDLPDKRFKQLSYVYKFRAQLQREFRNAVADMQKARDRRERASDPRPQGAVLSRARKQAEVPPPPVADPQWLMSSPPVEQTIAVCAPSAPEPDTR